jgi:hypothetical protein
VNPGSKRSVSNQLGQSKLIGTGDYNEEINAVYSSRMPQNACGVVSPKFYAAAFRALCPLHRYSCKQVFTPFPVHSEQNYMIASERGARDTDPTKRDSKWKIPSRYC